MIVLTYTIILLQNRPILRGRDIKRYGYEFADLWIIATFPSLNYDIESYPAVKQHLLSFGYDRLKQTGDVGARKKTNNQWFETQDSISYWDDFFREKIIWIELADKGRFYLDRDKYFLTLNGTFIMTGKHLEYVTCVLNNPIISWHFNTFCISSGVGTNQWRELYVRNLLIPVLSDKQQQQFVAVYEQIMCLKSKNQITDKEENQINQLVYKLYNLTDLEIQFIDNQ
jgi:adenine-specific DNA-methyltransferase